MAVSKLDIKFFLTSLEPELAQTNFSQSIGGHISTSNVYPRTELSNRLVLNDTKFDLNSVTDFSNLTYVNINAEVIKTDSIDVSSVTIDERGVNGVSHLHGASDLVYGLSVGNLFNNKFNDDLKQYRCIAVKNENASDAAIDVGIYLKQNTINDSSNIKIAIEIPKNDYLADTASGGSSMTLIDSSIEGLFEDDHFAGAVLRFLSGNNKNQSRIISSYDDSIGTFVLDSSLPFAVLSGDGYEIDPGPAQRVSSGLKQPVFNAERVTDLLTPTGPVSILNEDRGIRFSNSFSSAGINVNSNRDHGSDLRSKDVFYIWLERSLVKDAESFDTNSSILTLNYFTA
tara:strand:- start:4348 stop:5373 length:1026 start_codon:yes stop_codon:yes gene_type:complete